MNNTALKLFSILILTSVLGACGGGGGGSDNVTSPPAVDDNDGAGGDPVDEPVEDPIEDPVEDPIDEPIEEPNSAPTAIIQFPPATSLTDSETFIVRGTATDIDGDNITAVKVNGVNAVSTDGFANWQAAVPLTHGQNTLVVETQDSVGTTDSDAARADILQQSVFIEDARSGAINSATNQLLTADLRADNVVAIDLSTGARTVISDDNLGAGPQLSSPLSIEIAPNGGCVTVLPAALRCALIMDIGTGIKAIVAVDLDTGDRAIISSNSRGSGPSLSQPRSISTSDSNLCPPSLAGASHCALLEDTGLKSLLAVDLATGNRVVVASNSRGSGPDIIGSRSAVLASNNACTGLLTGVSRCVLMLDSFNDALLAVDLDTGNRAIVSADSRGDGPAFRFPLALVLDEGNRCAGVLTNASRCALVLDSSVQAIVAVDLATGDRAILSDVNRGNGPAFSGKELLLDSLNDRALILDPNFDSPITVDLLSGDRGLLPDHRSGSGPEIELTSAMVRFDSSLCSTLLDGATACALVADSNASALVAVDLNTGNRALVSDETRGSGPQFNFLSAMVLAPANHCAALSQGVSHCALVISSNDLFAVDLETGDRAILSDNTQGSGLSRSMALLDDCSSLVPGASGCALVARDFSGDTLLVDLDTGDRTVVSDDDRGTGPTLSFPTGVVFDDSNSCSGVLPATRHCGLVADTGANALFAVDLETGDRAILSDDSRGDGPVFNTPTTIVLDESNLCARVLTNTSHCALVTDDGLQALVAVDLDTGDRAILFDNAGRGAPSLAGLRGIVLDNENGFIVLLNAQLRALIIIDLQTDERVISAWGGRNRGVTLF